MSKYDQPAAVALRMITAKGRLVTFTRESGEVDPVTQTGGEEITYTANIVALPLSSGKAAHIFGSGSADVMKPRLDVHIALKGVAQTPRAGDRFPWSGQIYQLLPPELLDPAGEGAIYAHALAEA